MVRSPDIPDTAASVGEVISEPGHTLSALVNHARSLARVESLLTDFASEELATHFQVAAMRQDRLVLLTPAASWATRLRMQSEPMLQFLRQSGYRYLRHIDIRVAPIGREPADTRVRRRLSPAAETALSLMSRLTSDDADG